MHLFTPRMGGERARMFINDADLDQIKAWQRRPGNEAFVMDQVSGKRYLVRSADCTEPGCHCDAVVVGEADLQ